MKEVSHCDVSTGLLTYSIIERKLLNTEVGDGGESQVMINDEEDRYFHQ